MKKVSFLIPILLSICAFSQDSTKVEPQKPATNNYDLLLMAAAGLAILIALYFLFRKTRKK